MAEQIRIEAHVEGLAKTDAEFKEVRRQIGARVKDGLRRAGERYVLPDAKALAPVHSGRLRSSLIIRAQTRQAFITTNLRGKQARYVGLQEFGGTVRGVIRPKKAKALKIGDRAVAKVTAPRKYRGKHFMTRAVQKNVRNTEQAIKEQMLAAFEGLDS